MRNTNTVMQTIQFNGVVVGHVIHDTLLNMWFISLYVDTTLILPVFAKYKYKQCAIKWIMKHFTTKDRIHVKIV